MNKWTVLATGSLAAAAIGRSRYLRAKREADKAYVSIARGQTAAPQAQYSPDMVEGLPEIARRYFDHSIAPGTPLYSVMELRMEGRLLLGNKEEFQNYVMTARQVLRPPDQFAWLPKMRAGAMRIMGSDTLVAGQAWTRFWLFGLFPVANERTSPDLVRSAQFRAAVEAALWIPSSLLPLNGATWVQTGMNQARVTLGRVSPPIEILLTFDEIGRVLEVVGQRWSNANRDKTFRLQPFGATMLSEATYQGLTIPIQIVAGNHYGTSDYHPFFQVTITSARYK